MIYTLIKILYFNNSVAILILLLLLLPFIILCYFIHPSADDLIYSFWYRISEQIGFWQYQTGNYKTWNGRFFSTILLTINPLVYNSFNGYKILPLLLLIIYYLCFYSLLNAFFIKINFLQKHFIALLFIVAYINIVPSVPETLYWMSASITYFLALSFKLLSVSFLLKFYNGNKNKFLNGFLSILMAVFAVGSNELSAFFMLLLSLFIVAYEFILYKNFNKFTLLFTSITLLFVLLVVVAPGNIYRTSLFGNHHNFLFSLQNSVLNFAKLNILILKNPSIFILFILTAIFSKELLNASGVLNKIEKIPLYLLFLISFSVVLFFYFVSAYSTGINPPMRLHNFIMNIYLIMLLILIIISSVKIQNCYKTKTEIPLVAKQILFLLFIWFIISDFHKYPGQNIYIQSNIVQSVYDLKYEAPLYDKELENRYLLIAKAKQNEQTSISVPCLKYKPRSIFFVDIKSDSTHWINWGHAKYFGLKTIWIEGNCDEFSTYETSITK